MIRPPLISTDISALPSPSVSLSSRLNSTSPGMSSPTVVHSTRDGRAPDRDRHLPLHRRRGVDPPGEAASRPYGEVLADHRRILRAAFLEHGGQEIDTQGDAFFVAFRKARDAALAAGAAQCALTEHG